MQDLYEQLRNLTGRICLMGIGNTDFSDDGFGVRLAEELLNAGVSGVIIASDSPERSLRFLNGSFDHIVFLEALDFGGVPGSAIFLNAREIISRFTQASPQKIALGALAKSIEATRHAHAWLLGVQPASLELGRLLTPVLESTLEKFTELLSDLTSTPVHVRAAATEAHV